MVSVVVANQLHREVVEGLLAAGKHVLCEKPFAPTIEDAEAMVAAAEGTGLQASVGFTFRRSPAIAAVRELIGPEGIGAPVHFNGHYWCDYGVDAAGPMSWRYQGGPGSGALADIGSHLVDLGEFLCGPIRAVRGGVLSTFVTERALPKGAAVGHAAAELSDEVRPVENEDLVTFTAEFDSGTAGTFSASRSAFGLANALGFELFARSGAATFDLARPGEFRLMNGRAAGYQEVPVGPGHPYLTGGLPMDFPGVGYGQNDLFTFQARAFLEQVAGLENLPRCPDFAHGLHNLRVLEAARPLRTAAARSACADLLTQTRSRTTSSTRSTPRPVGEESHEARRLHRLPARQADRGSRCRPGRDGPGQCGDQLRRVPAAGPPAGRRPASQRVRPPGLPRRVLLGRGHPDRAELQRQPARPRPGRPPSTPRT